MKQLIFILIAIIGVSQAQTIQYIGAPTTTVISRGNFRTDSIFYLPKRTKLPTDTAALRYQISDSSLYAWTGSQWRKVGADADTLVYSTRAWRQKGDDSLASRINLKVNISDTSSMLTNYIRHAGYGLTKSGQSFLVDTLNISTRAWRQKGLDSLAALEVSGSGTTNYVAKFTAGSTIGNSQIFDNGTNVGINRSSPSFRLDVNGDSRFTGGLRIDRDSGQIMLQGIVLPFGQVFSQTIDNNGDTRIGTNRHLIFRTNDVTERMRIFNNGNVGINTGATDAGYRLDVNGTLRTINGAVFATTSGNVGIGVINPISPYSLHTNSSIKMNSGRLVIGQPTDSTRAISIGGNSFQSSIWLEQYGSDATDIFFLRGNGTLTSKTNIDSGNVIGSLDYTGYVDGNLFQSAYMAVRVVEVDATNDKAVSDFVFVQNDNNAMYENMRVEGKGGNLFVRSNIKTGAPTGGSQKPWKLGEAATVSPTSPNRTIRVEIDGTVYYLHAKTTND